MDCNASFSSLNFPGRAKYVVQLKNIGEFGLKVLELELFQIQYKTMTKIIISEKEINCIKDLYKNFYKDHRN